MPRRGVHHGPTMQTEALANAGYQEEIDHRSYERQGLEKTPGIHLESLPVRWKHAVSKQKRGEQNRLRLTGLTSKYRRFPALNFRNSGLTEPARRAADSI